MGIITDNLGNPIILTENTEALLTVVYGNDILIPFTDMVTAVCENAQLLEAYGLELEFDYRKVWKVLTPDSCSGRDVLMQQLLIIPRIMEAQDLRGNLKDEGRRNVSCSRNSHFWSCHSSQECFRDPKVTDMWKKHVQFTEYVSKGDVFPEEINNGISVENVD